MRRFETFTKALNSLKKRISALSAFARQLIDRKHMESKSIDFLNQKVLDALNQLETQFDLFRHRLEFHLILARFYNEVKEMSFWIDEKMNNIQSKLNDKKNQGALSLSDKLEHLKRHQALEIELSTNAPRIQSLKSVLNKLKQSNADDHDIDPSILKTTIDSGEQLLVKWRDLNKFVFFIFVL